MSRPLKVLVVSGVTLAVAVLSAACGTQKVTVPTSNQAAYRGATLFNQRCGGCHTLSYAATHGSASNIKTRLIENGPNFNLRCERPAIRVLYAIENGGISGATMPQNIVVGKDARDVATFVSTYAGRKGIQSVGVPSCDKLSLGTLPTPGAAPTATAATPTTGTSSTTTATPTKAKKTASKHKKKAAKGKKTAAKAKK
ncbi:MAG: cytochrome c [Actinomycetota bacterium]|nr:cytochrome c [Actinomycetota bacterium]